MFTYIRVPVADMRERPRGGSKIVSQALFGEEVQVGERAGEWVSIATPDSYTGWVLSAHLVALPTVYPTHVEVTRLSAHIYPVPDTEYGPLITLPFGVGLKVIDSSDPRWIKISLIDGQEAYVQKGDVQLEPHVDLVTLSRKFLGLPYTWGGRSSFGYDCSGFMQMLERRHGVNMPRDAQPQADWSGVEPVDRKNLEPGDLLYFGSSPKHITHTGMYLGEGKFINATTYLTPMVRIDDLNEEHWTRLLVATRRVK